jgi:DNA-directed RNA polymerase specialized sigma24 family protein
LAKQLPKKIVNDYYFQANETENPLIIKTREFIDALPENYRIIIIGCSLEYPHKEIAESLGISIDQVKVYYHRLKKRLEQFLQSEVKNNKNKSK